MIKVHIYCEDIYPAYGIENPLDYAYSLDKENSTVEISEEDLKEHKRIMEEWGNHQVWLKSLREKQKGNHQKTS